MFKKAFSKLSPILFLALLLAPVSRVYAQSVSSPLKSDAITGGDPEPTGEPDGAAMLQATPLGTAITVQFA